MGKMITKTNCRTHFNLNVIYDKDKLTVNELEDLFIKFALNNNFDIEMEAIESYDITEIIGRE